MADLDMIEFPDGTQHYFRDNRVDNLPDPMVYRGTLGTGGTIQSLPVDGTALVGDTYKVITAGTYAGMSADVGDMFICHTKTTSTNTWDLIPSGDEPPQTASEVSYDNTSSGLSATDVQDAIDETISNIKDTTNSLYHLGFYLDSNGGLCQVNEI